MIDWSILDHPVNFPHACIGCKRSQGPVVATHVNWPGVGDIYICSDVARANAKRNKVTTSEELARLVVHGTLHVAGHDHPDDESRTQSKMWKRQERILASIY